MSFEPSHPRSRKWAWAGVAWAVCAIASAPSAARAHFLWLTGELRDNKPVVEAFLSETPIPDSAELLKHIAASKISAGDTVLAWTKGDDAYQVTLPEPAPKVIDGYCDLGVMTRGNASFHLVYTARVQGGVINEKEPQRDDLLRLRLVARPGNKVVALVTFNGKPAVGAVIKAFPAQGDAIELKSDDAGYVETPGLAHGTTGLLAKWVEMGAGNAGGKAFTETRYYATLTAFAAPANGTDQTADTAPRQAQGATAFPTSAPFALMPEAVNSFGGAVSGDWLYVYSGHTGDTHKYNDGTTSPHFRRLNLKDRTTWEDLPAGPALQGVTLLAHGGKLYRVGGAAAKNKPGQPDDLTSIADFACFDPESKTWTDLPKLPAPRSTHDAVVVGDKLYVIGGWSMNGGSAANSEFAEDALVFDLAKADATWQPIPAPPFQRRALAVAENEGKIYVLGGLTESGGVVKDVDIFEISSGTWSKGPELPGSKLQGFAASAFGVGGRLYVSGHDGILHRLSPDGKTWEVAGRLGMPRLTHRLLPGIHGDLLAVGGNFAQSPVRLIESLLLHAEQPNAPKLLAWTAAVSSQARKGQAIALVRSKLVVAGGNRSEKPHAFEAENLLNESLQVSLGRAESDPMAPLPAAVQSAELTVLTSGRKSEAFLLGGIGEDGPITRTLGSVYQLDAKAGSWQKLPVTIPDQRGMFGAAAYKDAIWLFGGDVWDPRRDGEKNSMPAEVLRWDVSRDGATFEATGQKIPRLRRSFASASLGSKFYLVGGLGADQKVVDTVDVFDFDAASWSTIAAPAKLRLFGEMAALDGKLYLAGGYVKQGNEHFQPEPSIEVYDPASQRWSTVLEESPVPPAHLRMLAVQGRLLLADLSQTERGSYRLVLIAP